MPLIKVLKNLSRGRRRNGAGESRGKEDGVASPAEPSPVVEPQPPEQGDANGSSESHAPSNPPDIDARTALDNTEPEAKKPQPVTESGVQQDSNLSQKLPSQSPAEKAPRLQSATSGTRFFASPAMRGMHRYNSPTGAPSSPKSAKVCFVDGEVTSMSRPVTNDEHWTLYYFETHAAICKSCFEPLIVSKQGKTFCDKGRELAIDVTRLIYLNEDGKICSRRMQGHQEVRVEVPNGYDQTLSLLKAIQRGVRKGEQFLKPKSHDRRYYVHDDPLKRLAEPKRGSYYCGDAAELEAAERLERLLRYNMAKLKLV